MSRINKAHAGHIIIFMKERFLERRENEPLSLEEILEEMKIDALDKKQYDILENEIRGNTRLEHKIENGVSKYSFKPIYNLRNKKDLINLVRDNQFTASGAIQLDKVIDSMPKAEEIIQKIDEIEVVTGKGKKKFLYYNDKKSPENLVVEEDIIKYWRDVSVDGMDEEKIEDYLRKQGIASMKDAIANNKFSNSSSIKTRKPKTRQLKSKHNDHLGNLLEEYNPDS